jgi:hypothetical protein
MAAINAANTRAKRLGGGKMTLGQILVDNAPKGQPCHIEQPHVSYVSDWL